MRGVDLKRYRKELKLKQIEMCQLLSITKGFYSNLESGKRPITQEMEKKNSGSIAY